MEAHEAFELVNQIGAQAKQVRVFFDDAVQRAYFDVLIDHDFALAAPIVRRMLQESREPWTSTELARVLFNSSRCSSASGADWMSWIPSPEEQQRRMREGLLAHAATLPEGSEWRSWVEKRYGLQSERASR